MKRLIPVFLIIIVLLSSCAMQGLMPQDRFSAPADYTADAGYYFALTSPTPTSVPSDVSSPSPDGTQAEVTPTPAKTSKPSASSASTPIPTPSAAKLKSHFLDVGQGDSTFIELPNGKCMLIDSGEREYGQTVISYVKNLGYKKLDYVVITHAHSDHMGSMSDVLASFSVGKIYMPAAGNNTPSYEKLLKTIADRGLKVKKAKAGVTILKKDDLKIEIISPSKDYEELNDTSAVVLITYGKTKLLYMGDAEREAENDIKADIKCSVVKVGHHGSKSSSSYEFIAKARPKHAIISVGAGNDYGLPKDEIISRWERSGARVWRTDNNGTVVVTSNGKRVTVKAERKTPEPEPTPREFLVLNMGTMKIHRKDCEHVAEIQSWNYRETVENVYDLIAKGYTPCWTCRPEQ